MTKPQFTSFDLKCVGILTMLIDHLGCLTYRLAIAEHSTTLWIISLVMRNIGRVAFPLFVMLLVEGFMHTRSHARYAIRLLVFALVSEWPYRMCFGLLMPHSSLNIGFTLLLILLMLMTLERAKGWWKLSTMKQIVLQGAVILAFAIAVRQLPISYSWKAIAIAAILYYVRSPWNRTLATSLVMAIGTSMGYGYLLPQLFMPFYNGERGRGMKYTFYIFYPLHLLGLYFVARCLF